MVRSVPSVPLLGLTIKGCLQPRSAEDELLTVAAPARDVKVAACRQRSRSKLAVLPAEGWPEAQELGLHCHRVGLGGRPRRAVAELQTACSAPAPECSSMGAGGPRATRLDAPPFSRPLHAEAVAVVSRL